MTSANESAQPATTPIKTALPLSPILPSAPAPTNSPPNILSQALTSNSGLTHSDPNPPASLSEILASTNETLKPPAENGDQTKAVEKALAATQLSQTDTPYTVETDNLRAEHDARLISLKFKRDTAASLLNELKTRWEARTADFQKEYEQTSTLLTSQIEDAEKAMSAVQKSLAEL